MSNVAVAFPEAGVWQLDDLLQLPETGSRYEIIDGSLLVNPPPAVPHGRVVAQLARLLQDAAPTDAAVFPGGVGVAAGSSVYVPDVLVTTAGAAAANSLAVTPGDVRLVVEVLSMGNRTMDLVTKRAAYAAVGIEVYWLVDPTVPSLTVLHLRGDSYATEHVASRHEAYDATKPFPVTVVPAALGLPPIGRRP